MSKCKSGYYYCYTDEKCKPIPQGLKMTARFSGGGKEPEETGIDVPLNGNGENGGNGNGGSNGGGVSEGTLHKWFKGSKSKDGKGGWVNVVTGGTCASDEPGEGTPKCVSSAKRASMSKSERLSAARRKKKADPGQQQKSGAAKPTYVATDKKKMKKEEVEIIEGSSIRQGQTSSKKVSYRGATSDVKRDKDGNIPASHYKKEKPNIVSIKRKDTRTDEQKKKHSDAVRKYDNYKKLQAKIFAKDDARKMKKEEVEVTEAKDKKGKGSGTKDACYHKVKSRYSVWPSAYASGALVKCRKVGAANWGNKSESYEVSNWRDDFKATEYEFIDLIKPEPIKGGQEQIDEGQKCWKGYEKKGTKKMFGKTYNNCVKKEETEIEEKNDPCWDTHKQVGMKKKGGKMVPNCVPKEEKQIGGGNLKKLATKAAKRIDADVDGDVDSSDPKASEMGEFIPSPDGKKKIKTKARFEGFSDWRSELDEGAAWTKKEGKSKSGGLNEKGRKSYERENPGSDLKAPSKKVGNPRRKSFCARMKGMKKKLTSSKTANDPDSRINKSLRAWNC